MTDLRQKVGNATTDDYHDIKIIMTSISSILQLVYPDPGQSLRVVLSPNSVRYHHDHHHHHDHDHHYNFPNDCQVRGGGGVQEQWVGEQLRGSTLAQR